MKQPHYSLALVKELVAEGRVWLSRRRALDFFDTLSEAHTFAKHISSALDLDHFSETVKLAVNTADVYGIRIQGCGWYVKVLIDEAVPEAVFISLHPLQHTLQTNAGKVEP